MVFSMLAAKGKFCTPHININGYIKLGESDLCPNCSHIDRPHDEIINDILAFRCNGCSHINSNLPESYRKIIGED
jgi:predicted  nucleic acid-binding Zn ribbon protein